MPTYTGRFSFYTQSFIVFLVIFALTVACIFFLSSPDILNKNFLVVLSLVPLVINFLFLYSIYDLYSFDPTGKKRLKYLGVISGISLALLASFITVLVFSMYVNGQISLKFSAIPLLLSIFYVWVSTLLLRLNVTPKQKSKVEAQESLQNTNKVQQENYDVLKEDIDQLKNAAEKPKQEEKVFVDNIDKANQQRQKQQQESEIREQRD